MMIRYWFRTETGFGIGVTAYSLPDAEALIAEHATLRNKRVIDVEENIDVRLLDQGKVIPNMGPPNLRGIWFPNLMF